MARRAASRSARETAFWDLVDIGDLSDCWNYCGFVATNGYGKFWFQQSKQLAHRLAFLFAYGFLNRNKFVLHSCDNRSCCNPFHLREGTAKENTRDMLDRNRQRTIATYSRGSLNTRAKLNENKVQSILKAYSQGHETYKSLAERYGVTDSNIEFIVKRKTWKHVKCECTQ